MNAETKTELLALGIWIEKQFRLGSVSKIGQPGPAEVIYAEIVRRLGEAQTEAPAPVKPEDCTHPQFGAVVSVARVIDVGEFVAEIKVGCVQCGIPMRFKGVQAGLSYDRPTVTIDGTELHAPCEPEYEKRLQTGAVFEAKHPPSVN